MKHCPHCQADIKGDWEECPLCQTSLSSKGETVEKDPFPEIPLRFNQQRMTRLLILISILIVLAYFITQWFWSFEFFGLDYVLFGVMSMWLAVVIILRKRRNIAKGIVYLLVFLSLLSLYFDFTNGWTAWSITYAIPIICTSALVAMFLTVQVTRLEAEEYVLYLEAAAMLGILPLIFVVFNWTTHSLPSYISIGLSVFMFCSILLFHWEKVISELHKRMHI